MSLAAHLYLQYQLITLGLNHYLLGAHETVCLRGGPINSNVGFKNGLVPMHNKLSR